MSEAMKVLVLGAGTMGRSIAICFAGSGWKTELFDPGPGALDTALQRISEDLQLFIDLDRMDKAGKKKVLSLITPLKDLPDEIPDQVIEAVPEDKGLKQDLFRSLEGRTGPSTLFCTNTSAIRIDELADGMAAPDRLVGTHFWNPAHLVPLVEVIPGKATSEASMLRTMSLMKGIGRRPVRINRDLPGFVGNRLQHALQREALALVEDGVISPEDLDQVVRYSFGSRMPLMGPFERADLGGLDVTLRVHGYLLPYLDRRTEPSRILQDLVDRGRCGLKTGGGFFDWGPGKARKRTRARDAALLKILEIMSEID